MTKGENKLVILICHLFALGIISFYLIYFTFGIDKQFLSLKDEGIFQVYPSNFDFKMEIRNWSILALIVSFFFCIKSLWNYRKVINLNLIKTLIVMDVVVVLSFIVFSYTSYLHYFSLSNGTI